MTATWRRENARWVAWLGLLALALAGCSSIGSSGPSARAVVKAAGGTVGNSHIAIVAATDEVARRLVDSNKPKPFSEVFPDGPSWGTVIGRGDVLDVAIWEAPPAMLFGSVGGEAALMPTAMNRNTSLPEQVVNDDGRISIPFIGQVRVIGETSAQVERDITARLRGKAHEPQVIVRVVRNVSADVTVVGDVVNSARVPLTAKGERLLDVLASAGGVKQPVGKTTIQVTRAGRSASLPLAAIINDPTQNIRMRLDDVVTALFQPYSFTALGAVTNNAEINFEATGLTLTQALGRVGGLLDSRADIKGVFIFRLEDPASLPPQAVAGVALTPDGKIPVIYRVDLKDPASFFVAHSFPIRNGDLLYVSNAPAADLQKFVSIVSSIAFSVVGIGNSL